MRVERHPQTGEPYALVAGRWVPLNEPVQGAFGQPDEEPGFFGAFGGSFSESTGPGTLEMLGSAARAGGELMDQEAIGESIGGAFERYAESARGDEERPYSPQGFEDILDRPLESLGSLAGQAVGSSMAPLASGIIGGAGGFMAGGPAGLTIGSLVGAGGSSAVLNFGENYETFVSQGAEPEIAARMAAALAVPQGALDAFGLGKALAPFKRLGMDFLSQSAKGAPKGIARRMASGAARGAGIEAATEATQGAIREAGAAAVAPEYTSEGAFERLAMEGLAGGLGGTAFGTVGGAFSRAERPEEQRRPTEQPSSLGAAPRDETDVQETARRHAERIGEWVPLYDETETQVTGYINPATGERRTPEEHLAPIETPLSGLEPRVPTPEEVKAQRREPAEVPAEVEEQLSTMRPAIQGVMQRVPRERAREIVGEFFGVDPEVADAVMARAEAPEPQFKLVDEKTGAVRRSLDDIEELRRKAREQAPEPYRIEDAEGNVIARLNQEEPSRDQEEGQQVRREERERQEPFQAREQGEGQEAAPAGGILQEQEGLLTPQPEIARAEEVAPEEKAPAAQEIVAEEKQAPKPIAAQAQPAVEPTRLRERRPRQQKAPMTLTQFMASEGGVQDEGGEFRARDMQRRFVPGYGPLVRPTGRSLDYARERAVEAGYLREDATTDDLVRALEDETRGIKHLVGEDISLEQSRQEEQRGRETALQNAEITETVDAHIRENGYEFTEADRSAIAERVAIGEDVADATDAVIERSMLDAEQQAAEDAREAGDEDFDIPFVESREVQAEAPEVAEAEDARGPGEVSPQPREEPGAETEDERGILRGGVANLLPEGFRFRRHPQRRNEILLEDNLGGVLDRGTAPRAMAERFVRARQEKVERNKPRLAQGVTPDELRRLIDEGATFATEGSAEGVSIGVKGGDRPLITTGLMFLNARDIDRIVESLAAPKKATREERGVEGQPQLTLEGTEPSARQAMAARDVRGSIRAPGRQREADEGLFAEAPDERQGDVETAAPVETPVVSTQPDATPQQVAEDVEASQPRHDLSNRPAAQRPTVTPDIDVTTETVRNAIRRIAGDNLDVRMFESLATPAGNTALGRYFKGAIDVALRDGEGNLRSTEDVLATARHEAIHFLKETGAFTEAQWNALENKAGQWRETFGIDELYSLLTDSQKNEEAIAEAYARWASGELKIGGSPNVAFRRLRRIFAAVRDAIKSALGYKVLPDAEAVFRDIEAGGAAGTESGVVDVNGVKVAGFDPRQRAQLRGFHGSRAIFDQFDINKIGTGEGAQAFGYGLYIAESEGVGRYYRDKLTDVGFAPIAENLERNNPEAYESFVDDLMAIAPRDPDMRDIGVELSNLAEGARQEWLSDETFEMLKPHLNEMRANYGAIYRVNISAESEDLLDWDAPLSQQSEKVREALRDLEATIKKGEHPSRLHPERNKPLSDRTGEELYILLGKGMWQEKHASLSEVKRKAAERLLQAGISGIKYFDQGSRGAKEGTRNFVIFDDSLIEIEERYQLAGMAPGHHFAPEQSFSETIKALDGHNYSLVQRLMRPDMAEKVGLEIDKARFFLQDRFLFVRRAQEAAERWLGRPLTEAESPYVSEELYYGRVGEKKFRDDKDFKQPIMERMHEANLTLSEVDDYLYARHAEERNRQIASINPELPDGGSGITTAEAQKHLASIAEDKRPALEEIAGLVDRMMQRRVEEMQSSGLIDEATATAWRSTYNRYVPLRGVDADPDSETLNEITRPRSGRGFMGSRRIEKRATGRFSKAPDILATAFTLADEAIIRGEKNRIGQAVLNLAQAAPDPNVWEVQPTETSAYLDKATGTVKYRRQAHYSPEDTMSVRVNGREIRIQIKDSWLLRSLKMMGGAQENVVVEKLARITQILSKLNTMWNPEFVISNAMMDFQTGLVNLSKQDFKGLKKEVRRNWGRSFRGAYRYIRTGEADTEWSRHAKEFRTVGGHTAFNQITDAAQQAQTIEKLLEDLNSSRAGLAKRGIKGLVDNIEMMNQAIDNAIRLSTYVALRNRGVSKRKAASTAKNLTINFNRKGAAGSTINAFFMFFNAGVQGTAVMVNAMRSPKVRKLVYAITAAGAVQEMLAGMMPTPDDEQDEGLGLNAYDRIPEWVKQRNMVIPYGHNPGDYVTFRMPYGYNFFHNTGRLIIAYLRGARELTGDQVTLAQTIGKMAHSFQEAILPPGLGDNVIPGVPVPTIAAPFVEVAVNQDWMGKNIMPETFPGDERPDSERYYNSVSAPSREIASLLNEISGGNAFRAGVVDVSPESIDHTIAYFSGAAGAQAMRMASTIHRSAGEALGWNPEDPDLSILDVPFARKVVGYASPYALNEATYLRIGEIETLNDEVEAAVENKDFDRARRIRRENGARLGLLKRARKVRRDLSEMRKRRQAILENDRLSAAEKRRRTDAVEERRRRLMQMFNQAYLRSLQ